MTPREHEIWQRTTELNHSTANIAKALNMPESEVERIVRRLRDESYERQMDGSWLK